MNREELERLDEQGLGAWDANDADTFIGLLADDFVWHDWAVAEPITTKDAAREFFGSWHRGFPDLKTVRVSRVVGDDAVAAEIEFMGTNTGPLAMGGNEIPPTNKTVRGRGTYIFRVKDGKIVEFRSHPDVAGMMMQLGLMTTP